MQSPIVDNGRDRDPEAGLDQAFATVAVAASIVALGLAAIYWLARAGFDTPFDPVLRSVGLALFLLDVPYAVWHVFAQRSRGWAAASYSFICLATLASIAALGRLVPFAGVDLSVLVTALGLAAFLFATFHWLRSVSLRHALAIPAGSALFSVWTGGVVWGRIYKSPIFLEMLITDGIVHHDGVTLAALGNMLRTYHVPSMGLDGIPYMAYHWGSPWLFAQIANAAGLSLTEVYHLAFPVMMIPFFFGGLIAFAIQMRGSDVTRDPVFWILFLAATVGVMPITGTDAVGVWTSNVVISESYTVGMAVGLLLLATTVSFWRNRAKSLLGGSIRWWDFAFMLLVLPAGLVALGYLKISLMVLGFLAAAYGALRAGAFRRPPLVIIGIMTAALVVSVYGRVSLPAHREGMVALDFMKSFVAPPWWPFFFLFQFFWSLLYVVLRLRSEDARNVGDVVAAAKAGRILDVELVTLLAIVGVIPGLILHIDGGSAFYFSDVQRWVSVGLLLAGAHTLVPRFRGWRWSELRTIGVALLAVPLVISMMRNATHWTARMLRANAATRVQLYDAAGVKRGPPVIRILPRLMNHDILEAGLRLSPNYKPVEGLLEISRMPLAEKRRTAVFVPQSEVRYWQMLRRPGACTFSSYVVPSLTGMSMVDGMPPVGCKLSRYYGLSLYRPRVQPQLPGDTTSAALCGRAVKEGFERVLMLRFDSAGTVSRKPIDCSRIR
ncbi:MAG: hypothetical protein ABI681_01765 [Gemmatimonadales bacterium]